MANELNIYRGRDGVIDYGTVVATMDLGDTQVQIPAQDLPAGSIWHYVRRQVSECSLESEPSDPCIVRIDAGGAMILEVPNAVRDLAAEARAAGVIRLRWRYIAEGQEVAPTGFHVYVDTGSGFDFNTPAATVTYIAGQLEFSWDSAAQPDAQRTRFCVRAYAATAGEHPDPTIVTAVARASGPAVITTLYATVEDL